MIAAVLHGPRDVKLERRASLSAGSGEAVIRIEGAGLCGTDYRIWTGDRPVTYPRVMGHELVGHVVDVGPGGTVRQWTWVDAPLRKHPLDHPFAWALVKFDGAESALLHAVDAGSPSKMSVGMRVVPRWRDEREGHINDIECFVPEGDS